MQDTNLKHSWDLYAGSHANAVSMIANILATFFARGLSAFRGIFLGYLCSSFQNVICVKVSTRKPTQNCTDQKLTFVVLGHVAYLYFCVHTFCVNISTGHVARPAHGDPICLRLHIFALVCRGVIRHI